METSSFNQVLEYYLGGDAPDLVLSAPSRPRYILPDTLEENWRYQTSYPGVMRYNIKYALWNNATMHPLTLHVQPSIPILASYVSLCQVGIDSSRWGQNNFYLVYPELTSAVPNISIDVPTGIEEEALTARVLTLPDGARILLESGLIPVPGHKIEYQKNIITAPGKFTVYPHAVTRISMLRGGEALSSELLDIRLGRVRSMRTYGKIDESDLLSPNILSLTVYPKTLDPNFGLHNNLQLPQDWQQDFKR